MKRLYPKHEGTIVGAVMLFLTLLFTTLACLSSGCSRSNKPIAVVITNPLQVKVTNEPQECWLESMPTPPEEISSILEEEDVVRRVFVHIRQYNEMVQFAHDMTVYMQSVTACVERLAGGE